MPAYNFQKRFVPLIQAGFEPGPWFPGMKRHTMRAARKSGHARPGEPCHLFTAQRTKYCQRLGTRRCVALVPMQVTFGHGRVFIARRDQAHLARGIDLRLLAAPVAELLDMAAKMPIPELHAERFARADGFDDLTGFEEHFLADAPADGAPFIRDLTLIAWHPDAEGLADD